MEKHKEKDEFIDEVYEAEVKRFGHVYIQQEFEVNEDEGVYEPSEYDEKW